MLALRVVTLALMLVLFGSALGWYTLPGLTNRRHWIPWIIFGLFVLSMVLRFALFTSKRRDDAARGGQPPR